MKSIMQEASSISKAIEQGWYKAGCPQEFTVRILEEPQKNLMGLITTRSAKIALFFDDHKDAKVISHATPSHKPTASSKPQAHAKTSEQHEYKKIVKKPEVTSTPTGTGSERHKNNPLWNDVMIQTAQDWLKNMLEHMNSTITFTLEPQNFYLRITLSQPILNEIEKEKYLLATLSTLLLETIKKQFKTSLRGHKIVLTHHIAPQ